MDTTPEQAVMRTAADQHMMITRQQAYDAGLSRWQIAQRVASGRWRQVRRDVFRVDGRNPTSHEAAVLAVVLSIPGAVACGRTALDLLGVSTLGRPNRIEVSVPNGCRRRETGVRLVQRRLVLTAGDRTTVRGIACTTAERAIIDLARELTFPQALEVLEAALSSGAADRRQFVRRARACSIGRAGVRALLEIAADEGRARFRSWLEMEAARIWSEAGLPAPAWNTVLRDRRGRIGVVDAVFPGGVVVVELDGLKWHSTPAQRRRDAERDRRLVLSGRVVLRFGWKDVVVHPELVVQQVREALSLQGAPLRPHARDADQAVS
jgi:hypothetical protein